MGRYFRRSLLVVIVMALIGTLYWGWSYLRRPSSFPFHHLRVSGSLQYVNAPQIQKLAWSHLDGGFFSLDVDKLKCALLKQPWIERVDLRREWPDTLDLVIQEKTPEARWGSNAIISSQGNIFYPPISTIPNGLSQINAPNDKRKKILYNFQQITDDLQLIGLRIQTLNVSNRLEYRVVLSNGIRVMLGRDDIVPRFQRFVDLYPKIIGKRSQSVVSVDLRYPNGFAIQWKR